jgi:O-antigen biosynthesis protein
MDLSIVIVSYNTGELLDACIASIISRPVRYLYEIIVVDNASCDGTQLLLKDKYPQVVLIENERNIGFARAINQGFNLASGEYYLMLNPDTVVTDDALDKLITYMDENPSVGICGPKNTGMDGKLQYTCDFFPNIWDSFCSYAGLNHLFPGTRLFSRKQMLFWDYADIRDVDKIMGCSLMIRSKIYKLLDGLDENYFMYFEETDLCYRCKKMGYRVVYFPMAMIIHLHGQSSIKTDPDNVVGVTIPKYFYESQYYFFRKNYGILPMLAMRFLDIAYGSLLIIRSRFLSDQNKKSFHVKRGKALLSANGMLAI